MLKLLDQQQQLALLSTQKLKELEFKRKEVKESETDQKNLKKSQLKKENGIIFLRNEIILKASYELTMKVFK